MCNEVESSDGPKCPYCGHVHSDAEDWQSVVSYWGTESGPVDYYCHQCDLTFKVNENVSRSWTSTSVVQKAANQP